MNRINTLALALVGVLALLFASCEKAPFITMTGPRSFNFTRDGGSQSITFSCNRPWSVSSTESWVQITPSSGESSDKDITVTIKCSPNTTYDPRSATVTVKLEELSESITITQDTGIGLIVSPTTLELTNAAQVIEIEVQKNVQYSVAIDNESAKWIKQGGTKALTTDKVTFTISANESYDNREGKITFKQLDGDLSQTVTVRQSQTNGLFITTPDYNLSNEAHTLSVEVKANVEFEVTSQAEWIKFVETKALTPSTITLSVEANESYDNRTGIVLVKQKNGDLTGTITVNQKQTDFLHTPSTSFNLTSEAQNITLEIQDNVSYSIVIPDDAKSWISIVSNTQTKALVDDQVVLAIAKNTTYDDREASVTIKQVDGSLAGTISIKQAFMEGLIPDKTSYDVDRLGGTLEMGVQANVEYEVTTEDAWIHYVQTKALSASTVVLTIDENETYSAREGKVTLSQKGGTLSQTILVKQASRIAITSVTLNKTATALIEGKTEVLSISILPENTTDDKTIKWESSDTAVVSVEDGIITACATGTAIITATVKDIVAKCHVRVQVVPPGATNIGAIAQKDDGTVYYVFVSDRNLGASDYYMYGDYYAWGETSVQDGNYFSPTSYKWYDGNEYKVTKYCPANMEGYWYGDGVPDNKTVLDYEDDVANQQLGGNWHIPTIEEWKALFKDSIYKQTTIHGVKGIRLMGSNSMSIFLPFSGYWYCGAHYLDGVQGNYWSSSLDIENPGYAYSLYFDNSDAGNLSYSSAARMNGFVIRPVTF